MRFRALVFVVLLLAAVLLAASCGKSRNKAYAGSTADYAAALDQICGPAQAKLQQLGPHSLQEIVTQGPKIKSIVQDAVDRIDDLQPPDEVKSAADDFVSTSKEQISKYDDIVAAAKKGDTAKVQEIGAELNALSAKNDQDARTIGADKCVSPPSS